MFSAGEVRMLWRAIARNEYKCGCGTPLRECGVWQEILGYLGTGDARAQACLRIEALRRSVERLRYVGPLLFRGTRGPCFRQRVSQYVAALEELYESIGRWSGADIIVDSSKSPLHALLACESTRVSSTAVHLVRDPRGVAYSWYRTNLQLEWVEQYGARRSVMASNASWTVENLLAEALRVRRVPYHLVSYSALTRRPGAVLSDLLMNLGVKGARMSFLDVASGVATLSANHTVAGNPSRFALGPVAIRPDEAWKRDLPMGLQRLVAITTWPLRMRYQR